MNWFAPLATFARPLTLASLGALLLGVPSGAKPQALHPLFKQAAQGEPDTLEVFCIYVQFQDESKLEDESGTTGLGTFGSDKDLSYTLDPNGPAVRTSRYYLEKHFEFANHYFETVSGGRLTVVPRIFPKPNADGRIEKPIQLSQRMKAYNPAIEDKDKKQKTSEFNEERGMRLMKFVREAVTLADKGDTANNPFFVAKQEAKTLGPHRHQAFMIFHAGHSRLVDGGGLGTLGANTPNDFTDFFVTQPDFNYLHKATEDGSIGGKLSPELQADSLGVKLSTGDTLKSIMMLSESATQDKINWGINGILVNQIGRVLGMPDMFDVVQGISQLGSFCLMDFAGYNTLQGFMPVYPSAWLRAFMGWDTPVIAHPKGNGFDDYKVYAPGFTPGNSNVTSVTPVSLLKVPLNEREYLLLENRQRSVSDTITLYFSKRADGNDYRFTQADSSKVPFSFLDSVMLDSVCVEYAKGNDSRCNKKKKNTLRPEGILTGASSYDLGLPGSGLLVWRINDWFIEQFLRLGAVNLYLGDTLRAQYKGIEPVEADGFLTIGKEFKDPLGQPAFDYGSGSDFLPHVFRKRKNPPKDTTWAEADTLTVISPYGQANTNAWNDSHTHITLEGLVPPSPRFDPSIASFTGDSVFNYRDTALTVRVHWADNNTLSRSGSAWPASAAKGIMATALIPLQAKGKPYVVAVSDEGFAQAYQGNGRPALAERKRLHPPRGYDSVQVLLPGGNLRDTTPVLVNALVDSMGTPYGAAALGDSVLAIMTQGRLHSLALTSDSLEAKAQQGAVDQSSPFPSGVRGSVGPVVLQDRFWLITNDGWLRAYNGKGSPIDSLALPADEKGKPQVWHSLAAYKEDGSANPDHLAAVAEGGVVITVDLLAHKTQSLEVDWRGAVPFAGEFFTLALSDFDRDGSTDAFVLGSRGSANLVHLAKGEGYLAGTSFIGYPQRFSRSLRFTDSTYRYTSEDRSAPAIADLNQDGYPDLIFTGVNSIYAINWRGANLPGWPYLLQEHQLVGLLYETKSAPGGVIGSTPLVLSLEGKPTVFVASPDGLVQALDAQGKRLTRSSYDKNTRNSMGPTQVEISDWPLSVGGYNLDSTDSPFIQLMAAELNKPAKGADGLELVTYTGTGGLDAITVRGLSLAADANWAMPGGSPSRSSYLAATALGTPKAESNTETIQAFHLFPSPLRGPTATVHLEIGTKASKARIRVFDLAGNKVKEQTWENLAPGLQPATQQIDLHHLGPDVYSVSCEVWFAGGRKQKWERLGVVR